MLIDIVGGPLHGQKIAKPNISPVAIPVENGWHIYELTAAPDAAGNVGEVLSPAADQSVRPL